MNPRIALCLAAAALLAGGCATSYNMTLMPRDSGKLYSGVIEDSGRGEGRVSVSIDGKNYDGTWVQVTNDRSTGFVTGFGFGGGRRWGGGFGLGSTVTIDNPEGALSTALLQAADGSGLRCEFRAGGYGRGGGHCRDDGGREYDVQLRAKA
jgi:hypothetical protein